MATHLLEYDPVMKTRTLFHDRGNGDFDLETITDVEDVVEDNKGLYAAVDERARYGEMERVASIPMDIYYREVVMTGMGERDFKRWLNDRDHLAFRTRPGRI